MFRSFGPFLTVIVGGILAVLMRRWMRGERAARARSDQRIQTLHVRTRGVVRKTDDLIFAQLEALGWLRDLLKLEHPLRPTRHVAAGPDFLVELVRIIDREQPRHVLEMGSGVSTVVMAARLRMVGTGTLVALEHDEKYAELTRQELRLHGLHEVATVIHAPLSEVTIGTSTWNWYEVPAEGLPEELVELLVVDGPPGSVGPLARYPALPLMADRLAPGAIVLVDDARRPDEQEMARRWQAEFAGLESRYLEFESGAFLMTMPAGT
jgi:predicted O-methyltransferase YrrM